MSFESRVTELFHIDYPVFQGGMAWVATADLAAAVSEAGGLGIIGAGSMDDDLLRKEIRRCREMTSKAFGVNIVMLSPYTSELFDVVCEERVPIVTTGAGNPAPYMKKLKDAGAKVVPVIPAVSLAKRMESYGADAVIAEGMESGGHIGTLTTLVLVPQVVDAVSIPVIAAGGIADARGVKAAFALGAEGVQLGTRFVASTECKAHPNYKQLIVKAGDRSTVVTGISLNRPVRCLRNPMTKNLLQLEKSGASPDEFENAATGSLKKAFLYGDVHEGSFLAGQISGMIKDIKPVKEIIMELFKDFKER